MSEPNDAVFCIFEIDPDPNAKSRYKDNLNSLTKYLEEYKDKKIAVIPIVGPMRKGKSFLLNFMLRYLKSYGEGDWMGQAEKLEGFGWKTSDRAQTMGIWVSKPILLKKYDGDEIVIILMDTQGLFDSTSTPKDSATIVGLSLLCSSCLIFNVMDTLADDSLLTLEVFLQYGRLAAQSKDKSSGNKPFQNLMFLIRDWKQPQTHKFGLKGGSKYLFDTVLKIEDNQSDQAKNVRRIIKECFEDLECFLMPSIGKAIEQANFDGSADSLEARYKDNLKVLIGHLLNQEEIKSKEINNDPVTCQDWLEYLKGYIEIFKRPDMVNAELINSATAKTAYNLEKAKSIKKYKKKLKLFIETKVFIPMKELDEYSREMEKTLIESLRDNNFYVGNDEENIKESLGNIYKEIALENEKRRTNIIEKAIEDCIELFKENTMHTISSKLIEPHQLEDIFHQNELDAKQKLEDHFNGEERHVFQKDMKHLDEVLKQCQLELYKENTRMVKEFQTRISESKNKHLELYNARMASNIQNNNIISEDYFMDNENQCRIEIIESFKTEVHSYHPNFEENFFSDFENALKKMKKQFKELLDQRITEFKTEIVDNIKNSLQYFVDKMEQKNHRIPAELDRDVKYIKDKAIKQFTNKYQDMSQDTLFKAYLDVLNKRIKDCADTFRERIYRNKENIEKELSELLIQFKNQYFEQMMTYLNTSENITDEELGNNHSYYKNESVMLFESKFNTEYTIVNKHEYILKLNYEIDNEYKNINQRYRMKRDEKKVENKIYSSLDSYKSYLFENEGTVSGDSLMAINNKKYEIIEQFLNWFEKENLSKSIQDNVYVYQKQIENNLKDVYESVKSEKIEQLKVKQHLDQLINEAKNDYSNKMNQLFNGGRLYADRYLHDFHSKYKTDTIRKYSDKIDTASSDHDDEYNLRKLDQIIENEHEQFQELNRQKREELRNQLEMKFREYKEIYESDMEEQIQSIQLSDELNLLHEELEKRLVKVFESSISPRNYIGFYEELKNDLREGLQLSFKKYQARFNNDVIYSKISQAFDFYKKNFNSAIETGQASSKEFLKSTHIKVKQKTLTKLKSLLLELSPGMYDKYLPELNDKIGIEFEKICLKFEKNLESNQREIEKNAKKLFTEYESAMSLSNNEFSSVSDLTQKHSKLKKDILYRLLEDNKSIEESTMDKYTELLNDWIERELKRLTESLEKELATLTRSNKFLGMVFRTKYNEEMEKHLKRAPFLSKEELDQSSESVLNLLFSKHRKDKGAMSDEKFYELISSSVKDLYEIFKDKNAMNIPNSPAIGIDLGTTNSCVACYMTNKVIIIPNEFRKPTTPSMVSFREDGEEIIGEVAKDEIDSNPMNTIYSVKRLIGRNFNDESLQKNIELLSYAVIDDGFNGPKVRVNINGRDKDMYPEMISSKVLKKMKDMAETHLECEVKKAVITVPAYFSDSQKEATKQAGIVAGLDVLMIINEPTAAAIAHQLNHEDNLDPRNVLIYDFGGGTFDVAVLVLEKGEINVKAVGGDNQLGGDDIDENMIAYCLRQFQMHTGLTVEGNEKEVSIWRLRKKCQEHKCRLTSVESTGIRIDNFYESRDLDITMTRRKFEEINNHLFERTLALVDKTLNDANISHEDIEDIVLVGGSTRIPKVQQMLSKRFNGKALNRFLDPDEAVARGAAFQAAILNGKQSNIKLSDVTPISLGIEISRGEMEVIVPRNSKVPNVYSKRYTFDASNDNMIISVYEGEYENVAQNNFLGQFELKDIPTASAAQLPLEIKFDINSEGILKISAKIEGTGVENEIQINKNKK